MTNPTSTGEMPLTEMAIKFAKNALRDPIFRTADDNYGRAIESAVYRMQNSEIARCYLRLVAQSRTLPPTGEEMVERVGRAVMQEVVRPGPNAVERYGRAAIAALSASRGGDPV